MSTESSFLHIEHFDEAKEVITKLCTSLDEMDKLLENRSDEAKPLHEAKIKSLQEETQNCKTLYEKVIPCLDVLFSVDSNENYKKLYEFWVLNVLIMKCRERFSDISWFYQDQHAMGQISFQFFHEFEYLEQQLKKLDVTFDFIIMKCVEYHTDYSSGSLVSEYVWVKKFDS